MITDHYKPAGQGRCFLKIAIHIVNSIDPDLQMHYALTAAVKNNFMLFLISQHTQN